MPDGNSVGKNIFCTLLKSSLATVNLESINSLRSYSSAFATEFSTPSIFSIFDFALVFINLSLTAVASSDNFATLPEVFTKLCAVATELFKAFVAPVPFCSNEVAVRTTPETMRGFLS